MEPELRGSSSFSVCFDAPNSPGTSDLRISITNEDGREKTITISEEKLKEVHKRVFLPFLEKSTAQLRNDIKEEESFSEKIYKTLKRKIHPGKFPIYPKKPKFINCSDTCESYRRKLEDYFNAVFLDYAYLFNEEPFFDIIQAPTEIRNFLKSCVQHYSLQQLDLSTSGSEGDDFQFPSDPSEVKRNIGWLLKAEELKSTIVPYYNQTDTFHQYLDDYLGNQWTIPSDFKDKYILLFVPGLYTGLYAKIVGYYDENIRPFLEAGVTAIKLTEMNTFSSVHSNCIALEHKIQEIMKENEKKKIILIGHSKGGVDCISTLSLTKNNILASGVIAGCVCIQSPIAGTPFAKKVDFLRSVRGIRAMNDLNYVERKTFLDLHPLDAIINDFHIPVVCLVSEMTTATGLMKHNIRKLKEECNVNCDGLVCPQDAILPGSKVAWLLDIDHATMTFSRLHFSNTNVRYCPSALTIAAVRMVIET